MDKLPNADTVIIIIHDNYRYFYFFSGISCRPWNNWHDDDDDANAETCASCSAIELVQQIFPMLPMIMINILINDDYHDDAGDYDDDG